MEKDDDVEPSRRKISRAVVPIVACAAVILAFAASCAMNGVFWPSSAEGAVEVPFAPPPKPVLDRAAYDHKMRLLAHVDDSATATVLAADSASGTPVKARLWPANAAYPEAGALLPFNRIVAYYGNFYAKNMGVLGQYPPDEMLDRLMAEVKKWQDADPGTPVIPGIDYIAVAAQAGAGDDGKYRARMPDTEIEKAVALAAKVDGVVVLEVQAGLADLEGEIERLGPFLSMPQVHLAIDPEFRMKTGAPPGTVVGTVDAKDVNAAAAYLSKLVRDNDLPPKVLIIHRYTKAMVTNAAKIEPLPEVQVVMDMDGWGPPDKKYNTYRSFIAAEPVQFTGFKLFYKNDVKQPGTRLLTPVEILKLTPQPSFIQHQ